MQLLWELDNGRSVGLGGVPDELLRSQLQFILELLGLKCTKVRVTGDTAGHPCSGLTDMHVQSCSHCATDDRTLHAAASSTPDNHAMPVVGWAVCAVCLLTPMLSVLGVATPDCLHRASTGCPLAHHPRCQS